MNVPPVAGDHGGAALDTHQRLVGDHQVDCDRGASRGTAAGHSLKKGVCHDLAAGSAVAATVGFAFEGGVHRNALGHRKNAVTYVIVSGGGSDGDGATLLALAARSTTAWGSSR